MEVIFRTDFFQTSMREIVLRMRENSFAERTKKMARGLLMLCDLVCLLLSQFLRFAIKIRGV